MRQRAMQRPRWSSAYTQALRVVSAGRETPQLCPGPVWPVAVLLVRSQLHTARELGEALLSLAQRAHDPACSWSSPTMPLGYVVLALARCLLPAPTWRKASHLLHARPAPCPGVPHGQDPGVLCRVYAAWTLWLLGYPDASPATRPRGPARWRTSCHIPIVWRMRGVGSMSSAVRAGTCRPCTSTQRPPSRSRPSRALHTGRP